MKFLVFLSFVLVAISRKTHLKTKTKGNIDYKPELIEGWANGDALNAINDQKITLWKKTGVEQY